MYNYRYTESLKKWGPCCGALYVEERALTTQQQILDSINISTKMIEGCLLRSKVVNDKVDKRLP